MTNRENQIRIARDFYDQVGRMNFSAACAHLHEDVIAEFPYSQNPEMRRVIGRQANLDQLEKAVPMAVESMEFTYDAFYPGEEPGVLVMQAHSTGVRARGQGIYANVYVVILRFLGDKIIYQAEYFDPIRGMGGLDAIRARAVAKSRREAGETGA